jgi:hypothetical protein
VVLFYKLAQEEKDHITAKACAAPMRGDAVSTLLMSSHLNKKAFSVAGALIMMDGNPMLCIIDRFKFCSIS